MSPASGYFQQLCKCGSDQRAVASITIAASTLRVNPRRKSRAVTVYLCPDCLRAPSRKTSAGIVAAVLAAAKQTLPQKETKRR